MRYRDASSHYIKGGYYEKYFHVRDFSVRRSRAGDGFQPVTNGNSGDQLPPVRVREQCQLLQVLQGEDLAGRKKLPRCRM